MAKDDIRSRLEKVAPGTAVTVKLDDGTQVKGTFDGMTEQDHVLLSGEEAGAGIPASKVETVLMDVSNAGPE